MMRRFVRSLVRRGLAPFGLELKRRPVGHIWGSDPFADQLALLSGNDVRMVFDVGANRGQTTAKYRHLFPAATIHAFEPFPESFAELVRANDGIGHVHPHRVAVADVAGRRALHTNKSHYTNSLFPRTTTAPELVHDLLEPIGQIEVEVVRLDDFCTTQGIDRIDVLKMDVQGGEGLVLEGAAGLLAARAIRLIYSEVNFAPMYTGQANLWDIHAVLERAGYRLFGLYNVVHAGKDGAAWADVVYTPK